MDDRRGVFGRATAASAVLVAGGVGLLWLVVGANVVASKAALEAWPPLALTGARCLAGGLLLLPLALMAQRDPAGLDRLCWRRWRSAAVAATLLLVLGGVPLAAGACALEAGTVAVLAASQVAWAVLLPCALAPPGARRSGLAAALRGRSGAGLAAALLGLLLLLREAASGAGPGEALAAAASSAWSEVGATAVALAAVGAVLFSAASCATGLLYASRSAAAGPRAPGLPRRALVSAAMQLLVAGAVLCGLAAAVPRAVPGVPLAEGLGGWPSWEVASSGPAGGAFLYLALVGTPVGYALGCWLSRAAGAVAAGSYACAAPVVALALGAALLGESPTAAAVGASAVVLAGVGALVSAGPPRVARPSAPGGPVGSAAPCAALAGGSAVPGTR